VKNTLHRIILAGAIGGLSGATGIAQAQGGHDHHAAPAAKTVAANAAEPSEGEVRKVDQAGKKITLKHGPLKNLDMPPMTMVFNVADPALLGKVKVGDKVRFVAANPGGKLTITEIETIK
jgi:Cu(I)/Ag(I) efflux system protein CusF